MESMVKVVILAVCLAVITFIMLGPVSRVPVPLPAVLAFVVFVFVLWGNRLLVG